MSQSIIYTGGPGLAAIVGAVKRPEALAKILGRVGANALREHFTARDQEPNKLGGPKQHFWQQIGDSVGVPQVQGGGAQVLIQITDPRLAIKVYGGTIVPKAKEALTIPVDPESYGRTVDTFEHETGIQLFRLKRSGGVLTNLLMGVVGDHEVKVFYVLSDHSDQEADPNALPNEQAFNELIFNAAQEYAATLAA